VGIEHTRIQGKINLLIKKVLHNIFAASEGTRLSLLRIPPLIDILLKSSLNIQLPEVLSVKEGEYCVIQGDYGQREDI